MAVTLRDVARAAGVSPATASRALSAPDLVAPERRELVRRVARELGYRPNRAARELITGRSGHLCLVVPDLENPFFAAVAKAVQARARAVGLAVVVAAPVRTWARDEYVCSADPAIRSRPTQGS